MKSREVSTSQGYRLRIRFNEVAVERGYKSRREAARACDVHINVIQRLASGKAKGIEFDTLLRILIGLRCSTSDLFEIDTDDESATNDENASTTETLPD